MRAHLSPRSITDRTPGFGPGGRGSNPLGGTISAGEQAERGIIGCTLKIRCEFGNVGI